MTEFMFSIFFDREFGGGWWVVGVVRPFFNFTRFENARGEIKNQTDTTTPDKIEDDIGDGERDGEGA